MVHSAEYCFALYNEEPLFCQEKTGTRGWLPHE
jgi:hypothetical protein